MLRVKINKSFKDIHINIEFDSNKGAIGIKGVSGAGKTTVLNMIAGLVKPDKGQIKLDESIFFDSSSNTDMPAHERSIGYVFQEPRLFSHMNVVQNLHYSLRVKKLEYNKPEIVKTIDMLDIGKLLDRSIRDLSGGEKQRVAIGRALLSHPKLLLLDEPLSSLDKKRKAEILPYLLRLKAESNIPIIYVSHAAEELAQLADKIIEVSDGRILGACLQNR